MDNNSKDPSRYEDVPQKEGSVSKIFKTLGSYFKNVFKDFIASFKYNNMKLAGILVAVPGVFLGFFLHWHAIVVNQMAYNTGHVLVSLGETDAGFPALIENPVLYGVPFDFSGLVLFVLMLFGILNIFGAVTLSGKKNFGSVITCTITTVVICLAGALYLYSLFTFLNGVNSGAIKMNNEVHVDENWIISIVSIIISMVSSIAGVILGFINYDRTYEKADR